MNFSLFLRGTILTLFICCFSAIAQDSKQFSLPDGAIARLGKGTLGKIQFSPDSSRLAVSSSIGIWFYDSQTGTELGMLTYTDGISPFAFAYSPDGNTIASACTSQMIVVTGTREARLPSISGYTIEMWDVETGKKEPRSARRHRKLLTSYTRPMEKRSRRQGDRTTRYIYGTLQQENPKERSKGSVAVASSLLCMPPMEKRSRRLEDGQTTLCRCGTSKLANTKRRLLDIQNRSIPLRIHLMET